jgi:hypothetical protein
VRWFWRCCGCWFCTDINFATIFLLIKHATTRRMCTVKICTAQCRHVPKRIVVRGVWTCVILSGVPFSSRAHNRASCWICIICRGKCRRFWSERCRSCRLGASWCITWLWCGRLGWFMSSHCWLTNINSRTVSPKERRRTTRLNRIMHVCITPRRSWPTRRIILQSSWGYS